MPYLHFTLGPVQGFVAQARRTRDLAAGSFLLSYLSGVAIKAITEHDPAAELLKPVVKDDPLWLDLHNPQSATTSVGSIPNHFTAKVSPGVDGAVVAQAVQKQWQQIAQKVWDRYIAKVAHLGDNTPDIWKEQVVGFWDIAWIVTPDDQSGALAMRKNWRTYDPPPQGGDKCTLMSDWQEISGYARVKDRAKQDRFWNALRQQTGQLNLPESERLCAIALIKRLYPLISSETVGWELGIKSWPSTSYMAAVPWLRKCLEDKPESAKQLLDLLTKIKDGDLEESIKGEYHTSINSLEQLSRDSSLRELTHFDGRCFTLSGLQELPWKSTVEKQGEIAHLKKKLLEELKKLNEEMGWAASPYYALLLMDGDNAGETIARLKGDAAAFSKGLTKFANQVPGIIKQYDGKTIYAGGDDVLALLPLDQALLAADQLRETYSGCFGQQVKATISAAVVMAHHRLSLRGVVAYAHHLLDDVAKDGNGRNSLGVAALNSGGPMWQWVSTWQVGEDAVVHKLSDLLESNRFSSRFFYKIRERYAALTTRDHPENDNLLFKLLVAEHLSNREQEVSREQAEQDVSNLLFLCRKRTNHENKDGEANTLLPDGAIMVRFLLAKGVEQ